MVLVAQIYAPIEDDRTLYVFCCNTRTCSLTSRGWIVVRNQENRNVKASVKSAPASAWSDFGAPTEPELKPASKAASAWGDFSFDEEGTNSSVDALTALLEERDLLLTDKVTEKKVTSTAIGKATSTSTTRYSTAQQLPCWEVSELEESWALVDEEAAWEGLSAEDDMVSGVGADNEHINRLLKSYFEGEEDVEIVNMVKKQQSSGAQKGFTATDAEEDKDTMRGNGKAPPGRAQKQDVDEGEGSDGEGNEAGLSRSSRRQQVEAYFQRRVSFYPTQVLRYAYGGAPLWISHPSPLDANAPNVAVSPVAAILSTPVASGHSDTPVDEEETVFQVAASKKTKKTKAAPTSSAKQASGKEQTTPVSRIPCCEGCGKARVFECQLMPALLSYISSSNTTTSNSKEAPSGGGKSLSTPTWNLDNPPSAADIQRFQDSLGEGLDFGVVAIYSCPDSCENGREFAVVQGPPDIL